jgi:hypothetical protein
MLLLHHPAPLVGLDQGEVEHPTLLRWRHMRAGVSFIDLTAQLVDQVADLAPLTVGGG